MKSRQIGTLVATVAILLMPAAASAAQPVFRVGAASRSIAPPSERFRTHVGGFGDCRGCDATGGTTKVRANDAFSVQAIYIEAPDRSSANVIVSVPAEGMFAGYQQAPDLGITPLRQVIAAEVAQGLPPGASVNQANVIVSSIHCHACPTLVGIWGPTNVDYLRYVQSQIVSAVSAAQAAAEPAHLTYASADIGYANDVVVGQANANEGWPVDGQLSVLQARSTGAGRPIATYMAVPVHGNIVFGPGQDEMNGEHFGAAAAWLAAHGQGVGVVAAATLGDQTSPMQGDNVQMRGDRRPAPAGDTGYPRSYDVIDRLGALTGSTALEALSLHGHPVNDPHLGGAESYQLVPADNPLILGLAYGHALPNVPFVTHDGTIAGQQTADRAITPPYAATDAFGVWFTVLRVGEVAIASEPGEAFPHISYAIRQAINGAGAVFTVGNAQDQLGYYYEAWAYPGTFYYSADHYLFNVGKTLAEQNIQGSTLEARQLGFAVTPTVSSLTDAAANDYTRYLTKGGVQVWAYPQGPHDSLGSRGNAVTLAIGVYDNHARGNDTFGGIFGGEEPTGPPVLTVDGRRVPTTAEKAQFANYTFPCPGDYRIEASLPGTNEHWSDIAHVRSATEVTNTATYPSGTGPHPLAGQNLRDLHAPACSAATGRAHRVAKRHRRRSRRHQGHRRQHRRAGARFTG